jgi:hypothetical protein
MVDCLSFKTVDKASIKGTFPLLPPLSSFLLTLYAHITSPRPVKQRYHPSALHDSRRLPRTLSPPLTSSLDFLISFISKSPSRLHIASRGI